MQEVDMPLHPDDVQEKQKALNKTIDMILWAEPVLLKFPKYVRFSRVADITKCMDTMMERMIEANKKYYKKTTLQSLDVEIEKLRKYNFLSYKLKYISYKKYREWGEKIDEIGRIVGSWIIKAKR